MKCIKRIFQLLFIIPFYLSMVLFCVFALFVNNFNPNKKFKNYITNCCSLIWFHSTMAAVAPFLKNKMYVKFDTRILKTNKLLAISNHCSDYDWLYMLAIIYRLEKLNDLCILMKRELGDVLLFGYGIKKFGHLLLNRSKERDLSLIKQKTDELNKQEKYVMFLYPEGTYPHNSAIKHSNEFSEKENVIVNGSKYIPKNVLLPRKTGFDCINNQLNYDFLMDATIILNPYHHIVENEATHPEIILHEKIKLGQIMVIELVDKKDVNDEFLYKTFSKKDKLIEEYKKLMGTEIENLGEFKEFLSRIDPISKNDSIDIIQLRSKYSTILYCIPPLFFVGIIKIFLILIKTLFYK